MTTKELGCRVNHDVCSVLQWANQIWCTKCVIYDEWNAVFVGYCCHTFQVEHVRVWISECLGINHLGVRLDGCFESLEVVYINNSIADALSSKSMGNQVVRTTIEVVSSYDMVASLYNVLQSVGDSSCTRSDCQSCNTTLESCNTIFEHALSRVGQSTIDVTCIAKSETIGSVL